MFQIFKRSEIFVEIVELLLQCSLILLKSSTIHAEFNYFLLFIKSDLSKLFEFLTMFLNLEVLCFLECKPER